MKIGAWAICENSPVRLGSASVEFEKYLEDWIETEPNLLQSGIRIVARQLAVGAGIIDLLAIDSQGRWIVIEIKRGQLERKTIAQVIDYASCISTIPSDELIEKTNSYLNPQGNSIQSLLEERSAEDVIEPGNRDIELVVVGIGKIAGLDRMVDYLVNEFQMPISVVSFSAFSDDDNKMLLVRELSEQDTQQPGRRTGTRTIEEICELADDAGVGDSFREILTAANELGLYPRLYKKSIMYTPPFQRNRMLFTVWAQKKGNGLHMYAGPSEFAEFYPVTEEEASSLLGINSSDWHSMDEEEVGSFIVGMKKLFGFINTKSEPEGEPTY
jgi:Holliday junction resolvase-like predicted endonuclease|tara:strand:+ start:481 stop:1464 length:984 start_codon:yes stop_codon:yes gene_type:complete